MATQPTNMSFSVKGEEEDFEYCGTPRGLFCQPRNLASARFQRMIIDLLRFNRALRQMLADETPTARPATSRWRDFLARGRFSRAFVERLIVPQVSAVWSADPRSMHSFPVRFLAEFFANHGMLGFRDRPRWATVTGGSARYVDALTAPFRERIRLNSPVRRISREADQVRVWSRGPGPERYDQVVIATHSDQALALLEDPSDAERSCWASIPYQRNEAVLHTDARCCRAAGARARRGTSTCWREPKPLSTVTYYMNHLQRLTRDRDFCVTLNRTEAIDPAKIIRKIDYSHPVFTPAGVAAQARHATISGLHSRTHYCGAYWGWGFHEDGVNSALRACEPFGVRL